MFRAVLREYQKIFLKGETMKEINNEQDLANIFKSGELINKQAIEDNLELLEEIFKDFK